MTSVAGKSNHFSPAVAAFWVCFCCLDTGAVRRFMDVFSGVTIREDSSEAVRRVFDFFVCGGRRWCDVDGCVGWSMEGESDFKFCSAC